MKVEVLGTGCSRCDAFFKIAKEAAAQMGQEADIEVIKVKDV